MIWLYFYYCSLGVPESTTCKAKLVLSPLYYFSSPHITTSKFFHLWRLPGILLISTSPMQFWFASQYCDHQYLTVSFVSLLILCLLPHPLDCRSPDQGLLWIPLTNLMLSMKLVLNTGLDWWMKEWLPGSWHNGMLKSAINLLIFPPWKKWNFTNQISDLRVLPNQNRSRSSDLHRWIACTKSICIYYEELYSWIHSSCLRERKDTKFILINIYYPYTV